MAELKTKQNKASVKKFIESVEDEQKRKDSFELVKIFESVTKEPAMMWGTSIIGFGKYYYESKRSSQKGEWMLTGFSPRKAQISLYMMCGYKGFDDLLKELGPHKISSGSCLYVKRLSDIKIPVLKKIIKRCLKEMKTREHC